MDHREPPQPGLWETVMPSISAVCTYDGQAAQFPAATDGEVIRRRQRAGVLRADAS